uniref:Uncharacterized protein n=1 Tax=Anguilla anguilla TaxID=7936 RepID=A0A0E9W1K9_ANGAN
MICSHHCVLISSHMYSSLKFEGGLKIRTYDR